MVSDETMATIRQMIADGLIECICTVCDGGVEDENVAARTAHREATGHIAILARRRGAVVRRLTPKGRIEAAWIVDNLGDTR